MKLISTTLVTALLLSPVINASQDHHHDESPEEHAKHVHESHDHDEEPKRGGILAIAGGQHFELVVNADTLTLYADDLAHEDTGDATKIRLTILQGKKRSQIQLQPAKPDGRHFIGSFGQPLKPGDKVVALIRTQKAKPLMVKFAVPGK
jgi:hypothetical protein